MMARTRLSTGVPGLDEKLGGGLLPGTLTVVVGASGIGKTQLGLQFAHAGQEQEARPGIIFDMNARVDSQSHREYAERMFSWRLTEVDPERPVSLVGFFDATRSHGDYLHVFGRAGRRVTRADLDFDAWHDWQAQLARKLGVTVGFFYGNFVQGVRRAVIDGIEPVDRRSDSIQFDLFEYIYHQILRKDAEWVARDLLREHYRANADSVARHTYDPADVACALLYTSHEMMLDQLIERGLDDGDLLAGANTLIYMGKRRIGDTLGRALWIAKHRGSTCSDEILPYSIDDRGLSLI
jgi:KaiC/GvpD/RAD55 family RecA-like ATPase